MLLKCAGKDGHCDQIVLLSFVQLFMSVSPIKTNMNFIRSCQARIFLKNNKLWDLITYSMVTIVNYTVLCV